MKRSLLTIVLAGGLVVALLAQTVINGSRTITGDLTVNGILYGGSTDEAGVNTLCPPNDAVNCVTRQAPATRSTALTLLEPAADPSAGQVLTYGAPSAGVSTPTWATLLSTASDIVAVFASGSCSGYLKSDGSCDTPTGSGLTIVSPGFVVPNGSPTSPYPATPNYLSPSGHQLQCQVWVFAGTMALDSISYRVTTASGTGCTGDTCGLVFGIYNAAGTSLLAQTDVGTSGGSPDINGTGYQTLSVASGPVTINPGVYRICASTDSTALVVARMEISGEDLWNTGQVRFGYAANSSTGNGGSLALPATTGVLSGGSAGYDYPLALVLAP